MCEAAAANVGDDTDRDDASAGSTSNNSSESVMSMTELSLVIAGSALVLLGVASLTVGLSKLSSMGAQETLGNLNPNAVPTEEITDLPSFSADTSIELEVIQDEGW